MKPGHFVGHFVVCLNVSESQILLSKMHSRYNVTSVVSLEKHENGTVCSESDEKTIIQGSLIPV